MALCGSTVGQGGCRPGGSAHPFVRRLRSRQGSGSFSHSVGFPCFSAQWTQLGSVLTPLARPFHLAPAFPGAGDYELDAVFGAYLRQPCAGSVAVLCNPRCQVVGVAEVVLGVFVWGLEVQQIDGHCAHPFGCASLGWAVAVWLRKTLAPHSGHSYSPSPCNAKKAAPQMGQVCWGAWLKARSTHPSNWASCRPHGICGEIMQAPSLVCDHD